jgi:hypothetical protein
VGGETGRKVGVLVGTNAAAGGSVGMAGWGSISGAVNRQARLSNKMDSMKAVMSIFGKWVDMGDYSLRLLVADERCFRCLFVRNRNCRRIA